MSVGPNTAVIDGTIVIEAEPQSIEIPISAHLPPVDGVFEFDTGQLDVNTAIKINISYFLKWLGEAFGFDIPLGELPESLRSLTIAVLRLFFNTATPAAFDVQILIGSMVDGHWIPEWKPVPSLGLTLKDFGLQATNQQQLQGWIPALRAVTERPPAPAPVFAPPARVMAARTAGRVR